MADYQNSKIYQITNTDNQLIYIGSTTNSLNQRLSEHKRHYKSFQKGKGNHITSFKILQHAGVEIELVELYPCDNKNQLHEREKHYIESTANVNKCIPGNIQGESAKRHYKKNKVAINAKAKVKNICPCGGKYTNRNKAIHQTTKKHIIFTIRIKGPPKIEIDIAIAADADADDVDEDDEYPISDEDMMAMELEYDK